MTDIVERLRRAVNIYEITTLLANDAAAEIEHLRRENRELLRQRNELIELLAEREPQQGKVIGIEKDKPC